MSKALNMVYNVKKLRSGNVSKCKCVILPVQNLKSIQFENVFPIIDT